MKHALLCLFFLLAPIAALAAPVCMGVNPKASVSLGDSSYWSSHVCKIGSSNGFSIPDPKCTPGAVNPTVTLQILKSPGFRTSCIRATTAQMKAAAYRAYGILRGTQSCELDHLIPLELGGADTIDNLWPECGTFKAKDGIENHLAALVKAGTMLLKDAQDRIAKDWTRFQK